MLCLKAASPFWFPDYPSRRRRKGWTRGIEPLRQDMEARYRDARVVVVLKVEEHIIGKPIDPTVALRTGSQRLFGAAMMGDPDRKEGGQALGQRHNQHMIGECRAKERTEGQTEHKEVQHPVQSHAPAQPTITFAPGKTMHVDRITRSISKHADEGQPAAMPLMILGPMSVAW